MRLRARPESHIDIHMHTDHSPDCATPVEVLLSTAVDRGLAAIAVTDHNEISGALAAREGVDGIGWIHGDLFAPETWADQLPSDSAGTFYTIHLHEFVAAGRDAMTAWIAAMASRSSEKRPRWWCFPVN